MAPRTTGRAASVARRAANKKQQTSLPQTTTEAPSPAPTVAGISTSRIGGGGSARGNDFASDFSGSEAGATVRSTPVPTRVRSRSELRNANFGLAGGSPSTTSSTQGRVQQQQRQNRERRQRLTRNNRLKSDNLRASQTNTTLGEAVTAQGGRSTRGISDNEVNDLARRGFREGDFVPNRGVLLPDGTFDTAKLDQLSAIEEEAQRVQQQLNTLKERERTAASEAIATDTPEVKEEEAATTSIADAIKDNPMSRTMALLDEQIRLIREQQRIDERSINAEFGQMRTDKEAGQAAEVGQTSVALAQAGGYLGTSGSAQGVMLRLAESHRAELTKLDVERQRAIADARKAAANREFDVVREKARIVQDIEQEAYERELEYQQKVQEAEAEKAAQEAERQTEIDIMNAFSGGASTPQAVFEKLGGAVPAKKITEFLTNITKDIGGDDNVFKFSAAQNATLLGSGMAMDDIRALNEYVMENGYDETVRTALTPRQRQAADKIFRTGAIGSGTDAGFNRTEKLKLEAAGLLNAPRQEQVEFLYGDNDDKDTKFESIYTPQILQNQTTLDALPLEVQEDVRTELLSLGFGSDVIPQWYRDTIEISSKQSKTAESLQNSWSKYRKAALGEVEEEAGDGGWLSWFK